MRHIMVVAFSSHSNAANGAMFRPVPCSAFREAVMFPDYEIHELGHETRVPVSSVGATEICDKSEIKVPVSCVSHDAGNEPMLGK